MHRCVAALFVMLPWSASAQETGFLRLMVDPGHNFSVVVDGQRFESRLLELPVGQKNVSLWAPGRMVVDTSVIVPAGRSIDLLVQLPYDREYIAFVNEQDRFVRRKRLLRALPMVSTIGAVGWTMNNVKGYNAAHAQLDADLVEYERLYQPAAIRILKEETMPAHKAEFRSARNRMYLSSAVAALGLGATVYMFDRTARRDEPVFEDKQKARFEGLAWTPSQVGGAWSVQLSFPVR